ncbi:MAG: site-2 protease family protein [Bacteroidota bacterium]
MENFNSSNVEQPINGVLPKPILEENKKNWLRKSLISLIIYAVLFYFIFERNLSYISALLVVLLIHELGHFFAMKIFNYNQVKLFFIPLLGAYVSGKKTIVSQRQISIVILSGPLPGIIIGFSLFMTTFFIPNDQLMMLANIFLFLNLFNLLPFIPLDGGRLLEVLFLKQNHIIRIIFTIISILVIIIFSIWSKNIFFLIIPLSMIFELLTEIKNEKIRDYLSAENIHFKLNYNDLPDKDYWIMRDCILLSFGKRYQGVQAGIHEYSIMEGAIVNHISSILKTPFIKDIKWLEKLAILLTYLFFMIAIPIIYFSLHVL